MTGNPSALSSQIDDLVAANRILAQRGIVDAFGHVSARHPGRPDRFLLSRNLAPEQVTADDIMEFDFRDVAAEGEAARPYLERFIHAELYRARPDVNAVVHSHSPTVVCFSVTPSITLKPICHMCGFLGRGAKSFEIRDHAGLETDLLIRTSALGQALAQSLGPDNVVLMRGHGSTVVAPSLPLAVYRAIYTEVNARLQAEAARLGPVVFLTPEEADAALATEKEVMRPWNLWKAAANANASRS